MTTTHTQPAGCDLDSLTRYDHRGALMVPDQTGDYFLVPDVREAAARAAQAPQIGQQDERYAKLVSQVHYWMDRGDRAQTALDAAEAEIERLSAALTQQGTQAPQGDTRQSGHWEPLGEFAQRWVPDAPAAHTCTPVDERPGFEVWAKSKGLSIRRSTDADHGIYIEKPTRDAWDVWQARAARGAGTAPIGVEPVAEKWAIYYDNLGKERYTTGFMRPWKFYDSEEAAQDQINLWERAKEHYKPVKVFVYATAPAPVSTAAATTASASVCKSCRGAGYATPAGQLAAEPCDVCHGEGRISSRAANGQQGASRAVLDVLDDLDTYDPERDMPGVMEVRNKYKDGDYYKVEDVRAALARAPLPAQADGQAVNDARDAARWKMFIEILVESGNAGDAEQAASMLDQVIAGKEGTQSVIAAMSRAQSDTTGDHNAS